MKLLRLENLDIDGFWAAFEDLSADVAQSSLRDRLEASAEPLM